MMPGGESRDNVDLRNIFHAIEDDIGHLRISSLYEVDLNSWMVDNVTDIETTTVLFI